MDSTSWPEKIGQWLVARLLFNVVDMFFRDSDAFNNENIPKDGAVIFVCGPHANQFLDPLMVMRHCGRPVGFLIAAVSMKRRFVGLGARLLNSIPVARPQDYAVKGVGTVTSDGTKIIGTDTKFLKDIAKDAAIMIAGEAYAIASIVSDTELILKEAPPQPVSTPTNYKIQPKLDQSAVYDQVFETLHRGGSVGIFPEGGSHDRTTLLPLKAGFTIMALGALEKYPNLKLRIVPAGLNYFRAHAFRSTAYVEFGDPIEIDPKMVEMYKRGGADRRKACGDLLQQVDEVLKSVTVEAPDYQTLQLVRAARRLYSPDKFKLAPDQKLQLSRNFVQGFEALKEHPDVLKLKAELEHYNSWLKQFGLHDSQVPMLKLSRGRAFLLLLRNAIMFVLLMVLAIPGLVIDTPIALVAIMISKQKAVEAVKGSTVKIAGRDVLATWKIMVAMVLIPLMYGFWICLSILIAFLWPSLLGLEQASFNERLLVPIVTVLLVPVVMYSAVRFMETGKMLAISLRALLLVVLGTRSGQQLSHFRDSLSEQTRALVEKLGPEVIKDFDNIRVIKPVSIDFNSNEGDMFFLSLVDLADKKNK